MVARPTSAPVTPKPAHKPSLKLRMRVTVGETIAIGPGKIALLEALDETGSITAAARSLDMSYRRAWLLIDELNRALKTPAVATEIEPGFSFAAATIAFTSACGRSLRPTIT